MQINVKKPPEQLNCWYCYKRKAVLVEKKPMIKYVCPCGATREFELKRDVECLKPPDYYTRNRRM